MELPALSSQLLVAAVHGIYVLSDKGVIELFTSGSKGIAAATRTRAQDDILAVADSHVVILHDVKQGMQRTYRLKESGPPRQLWYDKQHDRLLFTTTLENTVQVYSLKDQRFIDPATTHPSPPLLFTVHTSTTLNLVLSASAKPPIVYITALKGGKDRARYSVQPHDWSAVCSAAAFHPAVGPGPCSILFVLGFTDGTIAAYSYSSSDLPEELACIAKAHIMTAENSPSQMAHLKSPFGHVALSPKSGTISSSPEVGDLASAVVAISLIPGFLCMSVSVGSDGCCCITDFEPETGPEIKIRWNIYGAATALAVKKDMIAIGLRTGKVHIYSMTGEQVFSREFGGYRIVDLEWIDEPIKSIAPESQVKSLPPSKSKPSAEKPSRPASRASTRARQVSSKSLTSVTQSASSQPHKETSSGQQMKAKNLEALKSPRLSEKGHRLPISRLKPPLIPPRPSRSLAKTIKSGTPTSSTRGENTVTLPAALDGTRETSLVKRIKFVDQQPKIDKPPVLHRQSASSSEYSDDYVLEWSYEKPSKGGVSQLKGKTHVLPSNEAINQSIANNLPSVLGPSQHSHLAGLSGDAARTRTLKRQSAPVDFATLRPGPLKLVTTHIDDPKSGSSRRAMQPTTPRVIVASEQNTTPPQSPASAAKEHSEAKKARMASPQLRNAGSSTPTRTRKEGSVELILTDARSSRPDEASSSPTLQPSSAVGTICSRCKSVMTSATSSGGALSSVTASLSGSKTGGALYDLKAELDTEHRRVIEDVGTVIASYEQRVQDILKKLFG